MGEAAKISVESVTSVIFNDFERVPMPMSMEIERSGQNGSGIILAVGRCVVKPSYMM